MQVLNLLLYKLRGEEPDPKLLDFLRADEHLVDIGDDLVDYEVIPRIRPCTQLRYIAVPPLFCPSPLT